MRTVIVSSLKDAAGMNIKERLVEKFSFKETSDLFDRSPVYVLGEAVLVSSSKEIIFVDGLDEKFGEDVRYVFISKHWAESGIPSLTAHFTGNFGPSDFGGNEGEISKFSPSLLKNYMISLNSMREKVHSSYNITLEATHHGPTSLRSSVLFVELGSTEAQWKDPETAGLIAESLMQAMDSGKRYEKCGIGIGGTHYPAKLNKALLDTEIAVGPVIPKYALEYFDEKILNQMVSRGDQKVDIAMVDQKGLGKFKEKVMKLLERSDLEKLNL